MGAVLSLNLHTPAALSVNSEYFAGLITNCVRVTATDVMIFFQSFSVRGVCVSPMHSVQNVSVYLLSMPSRSPEYEITSRINETNGDEKLSNYWLRILPQSGSKGPRTRNVYGWRHWTEYGSVEMHRRNEWKFLYKCEGSRWSEEMNE